MLKLFFLSDRDSKRIYRQIMMKTYQRPLKKTAIGHLHLLIPTPTTYATVILLHCFCLISKPSQVDISHKKLVPRIFTLNLYSVYYTHLIIHILTHTSTCVCMSECVAFNQEARTQTRILICTQVQHNDEQFLKNYNIKRLV